MWFSFLDYLGINFAAVFLTRSHLSPSAFDSDAIHCLQWDLPNNLYSDTKQFLEMWMEFLFIIFIIPDMWALFAFQ